MKCSIKGCKNKRAKGRTVCNTCKNKKYREYHPLYYLFDALRQNAKRRGKFFDLTLEQFTEFCEKTGYDKLKGKSSFSLSIDRIDRNKGYTYDNIQAITLSDNTKKEHGVFIDCDYLVPIYYCPF